MPVKSGQSDGSVKSSKSLKSLKGTLKRKASKIIKAVLPKKKKKKALDQDTLSLSSAEELDNGNSNSDAVDSVQLEVIDVDDGGNSDEETSSDTPEEDAEAELGR